METIFILFVLIVALIGLVGVRKENEAIMRVTYQDSIDAMNEYIKLEEINKKLQKSNSSNQGWNVKYRKTIEELKEQVKNLSFLLNHEKQSVRMSCKDSKKKNDESKIVTEKLLTMVKKKDMKEAKQVVKDYYQM